MESKTLRLLMIDDKAGDVETVRSTLGRYSRASFELESLPATETAVTRLMSNGYDLVLLGNDLPSVTGTAFLRIMQTVEGMPPVIGLVSEEDERSGEELITNGAYDYLPRRSIDSATFGHTIHKAIEKYSLDLQLENTERVIFSMATALEAKDSISGEHLQRMTHYAVHLGKALGLDDHDIELLRYGAVLHDVGKLAIKDTILTKPGSLNEYEWAEMRQHPVAGEKMCAHLRFAREVGPIIRHHHERWDGGGY
ncbi:MAG: HD domain-containing phosphohydrolase, partial [Chloroflexota bacterium]